MGPSSWKAHSVGIYWPGLILTRFTPSSLSALFQGFWILTLISTLGSWDCPPGCRLLGLVGKNFPPLFHGFWILTLISTLGSWGYPPVLDSHPHIYLGLMGLSSSCTLLGLVGKNACVFCFLSCGLYPNRSTSCSPLFWALIPGKPMALGLTYHVFVILARFSTAFILGFSALFTLGLVCPYLWTFRTCGNTTCGAFVFPPDKVMHCMILGWKTDMMGLMLACQFTMPFSIAEGQNFPHFAYNLAQHLSSIHQNQL